MRISVLKPEEQKVQVSKKWLTYSIPYYYQLIKKNASQILKRWRRVKWKTNKQQTSQLLEGMLRFPMGYFFPLSCITQTAVDDYYNYTIFLSSRTLVNFWAKECKTTSKFYQQFKLGLGLETDEEHSHLSFCQLCCKYRPTTAHQPS